MYRRRVVRFRRHRNESCNFRSYCSREPSKTSASNVLIGAATPLVHDTVIARVIRKPQYRLLRPWLGDCGCGSDVSTVEAKDAAIILAKEVELASGPVVPTPHWKPNATFRMAVDFTESVLHVCMFTFLKEVMCAQNCCNCNFTVKFFLFVQIPSGSSPWSRWQTHAARSAGQSLSSYLVPRRHVGDFRKTAATERLGDGTSADSVVSSCFFRTVAAG